MEPLRQRFMDPLRSPSRRGLRAAQDAQASMTAVFGLLQHVNAYGQLLRAGGEAACGGEPPGGGGAEPADMEA